jgi:ABC-type branched-subunit amino acid transport system substrate-binding protein
MKPNTVSKVFLEELRNKNIKNISILRVNNSGIASVYQSIKDLSPNYGITISSDDVFQPGEKDFKSVALKSISSKPDEYVVLALSPEIELITKQLNDYGVKNVTTAFYFDVAQKKEIFEGLWFAGYSKLDDMSFEERYRDRFKRELTFGVPNFYDAFNIVVDTAERYNGNQKPDSNYFTDKIGQLKDFKGVLGNLTSDVEGIIDTPASIKVFTARGTDFMDGKR